MNRDPADASNVESGLFRGISFASSPCGLLLNYVSEKEQGDTLLFVLKYIWLRW
jgi:hypothetical protein